MSGAVAAKQADTESEKGRVGKTKVKRYWPGRAPDWIDAHEHDQNVQYDTAPKERSRTEVAAPVIVRRTDDPRLRRLAQAQAQHTEEDREDALQRRREIRAAEVVVRRRHADDEAELEADVGKHVADLQLKEEPGDEEDSEPLEGDVPVSRGRAAPKEDENDEESLRKRQAVRERLLQHQKAQEAAAAAAAAPEDEEEEEEEDESEYETDSEDEMAGRRLLKPVFVPKQARETIAEREALEKEQEEQEEKEKKRLVERKYETQVMVRERISLEELAAKESAQTGPLQVEDVDTDDEKDPVDAYEAWKQRELRRIKRDREDKERMEKELQERERLRSMTEEERAAWDAANPKANQSGEKKKLKFMQKYWHKGAYFQDQADDERGTAGGYDIFKRDFSAPTGEDKFDRAVLPKVMQVKNFGRSGRTKWTHLVAEDTTFNAAAADAQDVDPMIQSLKEHARKRPTGSRPEDFAKPKKFKA